MDTPYVCHADDIVKDDLRKSYIVIVETSRNTIWCRFDTLTQLEAVSNGELLASQLHGKIINISPLYS